MDEGQIIQRVFHERDIVFYAVVLCVGCFAGIFRAARDIEYRSYYNLCYIGVVSGIFSFAVVGIVYRWVGSPGNDEWFFLALAALLGLLGKEQDKIMVKVADKVFKFIGIQDADKK